MAGQMSSSVNRKGTVLWLMGLTVLYQLAYQVVMWHRLRQEAIREASCGGSLGGSAQCLEVQLFRAWERAAPAWQAMDAGSEAQDGLIEDMTPAPAAGNRSTHEKAIALAIAVAHGEATSATTTPPNAQFAAQVAGSAAWSPVTPWARGLLDLQERLEARRQALPSVHREHDEDDLSAQLDRHMRSILESLNQSKNAKWADNLTGLQRSLEARMTALPNMRHRHAQEHAAQLDSHAKQVMASLNRSSVTHWAQGLVDLQARLQARMGALLWAHRDRSERRRQTEESPADATLSSRIGELHKELCQTPQHRRHPNCAEFLSQAAQQEAKSSDGSPTRTGEEANGTEEVQARTGEGKAGIAVLSSGHKTWSQDFVDRVQQAHREMCQEPYRRHRLACVEFLSEVAQARHRTKAALRANISQDLRQRTAALDQDLAEMLAERRHWEEALLRDVGGSPGSTHGTSPATSTAHGEPAQSAHTSLRHGRRRLRWSAAGASSWKGKHAIGSRRVVRRDELQASQWAGTAPKVACIAAVPAGHADEGQMQRVIENFKKQRYEGATQLVLVHHYKDKEAASLLQKYADGSRIKGVAARSAGAFPSATALRFGAWSAEAEVIAAWEYHEWHHPLRLSLQVRALAYSSRPACLLKGLAGLVGTTWEESLAGEAGWMREHWHPLLEEQVAVLEGSQAGRVVEVDMDASHHANANASASGGS